MIQTFISSLFSQRANSSLKSSSREHNEKKNTQSGYDMREDGRVSYGYALLRGKRSTMEDYHDAQFKKQNNGEIIGFFGIFDGHGGPDAAKYVRGNLFNNLLQHPKFTSDVELAVEEAYVQTDMRYLQEHSTTNDDGCTAVTAILIGRKLIVANVGDSRAVLCRNGKAIQLSIDHKPNQASEKQRIESLGGMVVWAGTWRVGGVLAVSRAFGDRPLKRYVVAEPHTITENLTSLDEHLILASDGIWDVISNEEAVNMVRQQRNPQKAANHITEVALNRGSNDNISCVVIRFNFS